MIRKVFNEGSAEGWARAITYMLYEPVGFAVEYWSHGLFCLSQDGCLIEGCESPYRSQRVKYVRVPKDSPDWQSCRQSLRSQI